MAFNILQKEITFIWLSSKSTIFTKEKEGWEKKSYWPVFYFKKAPPGGLLGTEDDESLLIEEVDAEMARGVVVPHKVSSGQQTTNTNSPASDSQGQSNTSHLLFPWYCINPEF